jgi:hypothetical protein
LASGGERSYDESSPTLRTPLKPPLVKAILTDVQFWIPAAVLAVGIALLVALA